MDTHYADVLDTVDFVMGDGTVVFRTCSAERDKVVFQIVSKPYLVLFLSACKLCGDAKCMYRRETLNMLDQLIRA